jgi:hypothetical protein
MVITYGSKVLLFDTIFLNIIDLVINLLIVIVLLIQGKALGFCKKHQNLCVLAMLEAILLFLIHYLR